MLTFRNVDGSPSDAVYFPGISDQFAQGASRITAGKVVLNHEAWSDFQVNDDLHCVITDHPHIKELIFAVAEVEEFSNLKDEGNCLRFIPLKRGRIIWDVNLDEFVFRLNLIKEDGMEQKTDGTIEEWEFINDDLISWEVMKANIEEAFDDYYEGEFGEETPKKPYPRPQITFMGVKKVQK